MKNKRPLGRLDADLFTVVYAKEKDHFCLTYDYGIRTKGDKFVVLTADIPKLSVSLQPTKVKAKVEDRVITELPSVEVAL